MIALFLFLSLHMAHAGKKEPVAKVIHGKNYVLKMTAREWSNAKAFSHVLKRKPSIQPPKHKGDKK